MIKLAFIFSALLFSYPVQASSVPDTNYAKLLAANPDQPFPPYKELLEKYGKNQLFDKGYDYGWNIGKIFKPSFRRTIRQYGTSEKRLKTATEDQMLEAIMMMPKSTYPYIGPFLHTIPGMSEKILNLPGIKESKNQFPERIAPELQNIEELEFVSPALYYALMPEAWPQAANIIERPQKSRIIPKDNYDQQFYDNLEKVVSLKNYMPNAPKESQFSRDSLRTINPDAHTLLTSKDVQAVIRTFPSIAKLNADFDTVVEMVKATDLLNAWEADNGLALPVPALKDVVNPCSRLVQKFRIIGQEKKLAKIAATQGFSLSEWAYTCDKTVKAYRAATMSLGTASSLAAFRSGSYNAELEKLPPKTREGSYTLMHGLLGMYEAPLSDIIAVRKNRKAISDSFSQMNNLLVIHPVKGID